MEVLNERAKTHGSYRENAALVQRLKSEVRQTDGWYKLDAYEQEAIDMIFHKMARIITGNPKFIDSWRDIAGYAQLVIDETEKDPKALDVKQEYFHPKAKEELTTRPTID